MFGIVLSVDPVAAVFNAVTINIKWVLDFSEGDLTCSISLGDGHVIYQHGKEGLESSVVHIYTHPNSFLVAVECTSHKVQVTAQKIISVQEPVMAFGEIKCHAESLSFNATNCTVLDGEPFQLQMEVKAGSNVTYRVQRQDIVLTSLYVLRGDVSHNITLTPEMVTQLGPGCHQLSLYASNMVTFPEVSTELQRECGTGCSSPRQPCDELGTRPGCTPPSPNGSGSKLQQPHNSQGQSGSENE
ncbi:polycystic kidney disease protein 1-like 2 [Sphaeramia orbicularis]|uniref:polycystic kidney disease protein 1-like 2 n=1 Tax=Sphaeramia orbicularis TaxID=375764 RepID=UPI00117D36B4|nr:polycystic kidney disease protein 1-like 2 [Sphaeramia orbicularis]